ncbi:hypothetical protein MPTK2_7g11910 [Marchantia polymorpha subsp. ruderalis]
MKDKEEMWGEEEDSDVETSTAFSGFCENHVRSLSQVEDLRHRLVVDARGRPDGRPMVQKFRSLHVNVLHRLHHRRHDAPALVSAFLRRSRAGDGCPRPL